MCFTIPHTMVPTDFRKKNFLHFQEKIDFLASPSQVQTPAKSGGQDATLPYRFSHSFNHDGNDFQKKIGVMVNILWFRLARSWKVHVCVILTAAMHVCTQVQRSAVVARFRTLKWLLNAFSMFLASFAKFV